MARGFPERWKEILKKHQALVPTGASFARWKQAAKDASAEYRGLTQPNPDYSQYVKGVIALGFVWLILRAVQSGQLSPAGIKEQMSGDTGL